MPLTKESDQDEQGAALILAMVFVFIIGLLLVAIVKFAGAAATNTYNLRSQRTIEANADSAATIATQYARFHYASPSANPSNCLPPGTVLPMAVFCTGTSSPGSAATRVVQLYTCFSGTSQSTCTAPSSTSVIIYAVVTFDDVPPPASGNSCGPAGAPCGIQVTVDTWDVRTADN